MLNGSRKRLEYALKIVLVGGLFVSQTSFVRADQELDVAPPDPATGSGPVPENEQTQVRMVSEHVVLSIEDPLGHNPGYADVTADFVMRNLGAEAETLAVRFPLDATASGYGLCGIPVEYDYDSIRQVAVTVDGVPQPVTYTRTTFQTEARPTPGPRVDVAGDAEPTLAIITITRNCWATFTATFPPQKDVALSVRYQTEPQIEGSSAEYSYILETGAAWRDTIGSGEIEVIFPYDLTSENYHGCRAPDGCTVEGRTVRMTFTNLEPAYGSNVYVWALPPNVWRRLHAEREWVAIHPSDGEAWGRLARAYKEGIVQRKGFRSDDLGITWFRLSDAAYRKALELLPNDADWHYGYADLLCWNAAWNQFDTTFDQATHRCLEELRVAVTLQPGHPRATTLLNQMAEFGFEYVDQPVAKVTDGFDFLYLTPSPTPKADAVQLTPTATAETPAPTAPPATPTRVVGTRTPAPTVSPLPPSTAETGSADATQPHSADGMPLLLAALVLGVIVIVGRRLVRM